MYNLFIFYTLLSALISSDIYNLFVNFYSTSLIYITITLTNRYINMREIFVILLLSANFEKNIEQMLKYYLMAVDKKNNEAMCSLANYYAEQDDIDNLKKYYKEDLYKVM